MCEPSTPHTNSRYHEQESLVLPVQWGKISPATPRKVQLGKNHGCQTFHSSTQGDQLFFTSESKPISQAGAQASQHCRFQRASWSSQARAPKRSPQEGASALPSTAWPSHSNWPIPEASQCGAVCQIQCQLLPTCKLHCTHPPKCSTTSPEVTTGNTHKKTSKQPCAHKCNNVRTRTPPGQRGFTSDTTLRWPKVSTCAGMQGIARGHGYVPLSVRKRKGFYLSF